MLALRLYKLCTDTALVLYWYFPRAALGLYLRCTANCLGHGSGTVLGPRWYWSSAAMVVPCHNAGIALMLKSHYTPTGSQR